MPGIEDRFRDLDRLEVPNLLPDIRTRQPRPAGPPRSGERLLTLLVALAVAGAGIGVAGWAFFGNPAGNPAEEGAVSVVGRAEEVPLECEVRLLTPSVQPGEVVEAEFVYRNVGDRPLKLALLDPMEARLIVRGPDGRLVWDTDFGGQYVAGLHHPYDLEPGQEVEAPTGFVALWSGPLTLEPVCNYLVLEQEGRIESGDFGWVPQARGLIDLAPLRVEVAGSVETPTRQEALESALAETGGLFEHCRPDVDGSPVSGSIHAPGPVPGGVDPSLEASCRADIRRGSGFAVVELLFISPPELPLPEPGTGGHFPGFELPKGVAPAEAGWWTFVVTEAGARETTPDYSELFVPRWSGLRTFERPPQDCENEHPESSCEPVRFSFRGGEWVRLPSSGWFAGGITFFVPDQRLPVGDPIAWASGEQLGTHWEVFTVSTGQGVELGLMIEEQSGQTLVRSVPDPCPVDVASITSADLTPSLFGEGSHLLVIGPMAPDVASVEVVVDTGRSVTAERIEIDDAPFDAFVAYIEGDGAQVVAALVARDAAGRVIDAPENCSQT
jgi:hypothetical protein